jgi:cytochrome c biogenesis protein
MYRSWWFQGLIIMLVINIIICSIDRLQTTGKIIFSKNPKFNVGTYRKRKLRKDFTLGGNMGTIKDGFSAFMSKEYGYCKTTSIDKGFAITAEKGRLTRLGVYGIHLSVVVLLIGSLMGSLNGFEGFVNIPEGESSDTIQMRFGNGFEDFANIPDGESEGESSDSIQTRFGTGTIKLPFAIQCDDFDVQFYDTGAPKEFRSKLTIIENGRPVLQKDIIVNDPLRYKGINIFQSSYGKLNHSTPAADLSKEIELSIKSNASGMIYNVKTSLKKSVELPEGLGQFVIDDFHPAAQFRGMAVGPALHGTLTPAGGVSQMVMLPINFPKFDNMRKGKVVLSVAKADISTEERYYTGLQITKDPGVGLVYTGFMMMILGCMVTFFMSHQQVVVEIQPKGNNIRVMVSGKTNKNKVGFTYKMERLADKLASMHNR